MKKILIYFILLNTCISLAAQNPVETFIDNPVLRYANISLQVRDLNNGTIVAEHLPHHSMIPASTTKLITTATALELRGADFRFETHLAIDGEISADSTLFGNIIVIGGGDPTLGSKHMGDSKFMQTWVRSIKLAGIKEIKGGICVDAGKYDDEGINPKWLWEDMGSYYGAASYGISYMDNNCTLFFKSGQAGTTPELLRIEPNIPLQITNKLKAANIKSDSTYILGAPYTNQRLLRGLIPQNKEEYSLTGDIPDPAMLLAQHFHDALIQSGVSINNSPTTKFSSSNQKQIIHTHYSPVLSQIVGEINTNSNNQYAEQLFRHLSLLNDSIASSAKSIKLIRDYWEPKGIPINELFTTDGSGLSPTNAISANFFVNLLVYMKKSSPNFEAFASSLPVAGETGTLKSFLKKTSLQGKVLAKTGTISRVRCYAGYINYKDKNYAFAILVNNATGKAKDVAAKVEEFLIKITE